ncbi:MAG TPA: phosphatase PAP2 family protein [Gemmatimonadaceae bacterium]|nr:phosphatase PAP2 family protein [Gemmatimonadaceae bacterium]
MTTGPPRRRRAAAIALAVFGSATTALAALTQAVLHTDRVARWDRASDSWFYAHETPAGDRLAVLVSFLGLPGAWIVGVVVGLVLVWMRQWLLLGGWVVALGGGGLLELGLKAAIDRARPPYGTTLLHGHSSSFPSGHAMAACVCYVMLAYVMTQLVALDRSRVVMVYAAAGLIIAAVSFSRLYLALHYPSDVLAGLLAAAAWLALCIGGMQWAKR